jgi:hypothetical protein
LKRTAASVAALRESAAAAMALRESAARMEEPRTIGSRRYMK